LRTNEEILAEINVCSRPLGTYKVSSEEKRVGRSRAYRDRICAGSGDVVQRSGRARQNRGQVPMALKAGELTEVDMSLLDGRGG